MIKAIRKRARPDTLKNQIRAGGQSFARKLYFYSIVTLFSVVTWTFTGHWFFLDAEGLAIKDRVVVAPDYQARVLTVAVKPGDHVTVGQPIAILQSREILEQIADVTSRRAQLTTREGQIAARLMAIDEVLPIAEERLGRATDLARRLSAVDTSEQTTDLSQRRATALARRAQITAQTATIRQTAASAQQRHETARQRFAQMDDLFRRKLTTAPRLTEAQNEFHDAERQLSSQTNQLAALEAEAKSTEANLAEIDAALAQARVIASSPRQAEGHREVYEAQRELATLRTERAALQAERISLRGSLDELDAAIRQVQASYNNGRVLAQVDGTVGPRVPSTGQVVKSGEPMLDVYRGATYVWAFVPTGRLYTIAPGDTVRVTDGQGTAMGFVARLEVVTDALPPEFQVTFRATDRQQVARIEFREPPPFPISAKVRVSTAWSPQGAMAFLKGAATGAGAVVSGWLRGLATAISGPEPARAG